MARRIPSLRHLRFAIRFAWLRWRHPDAETPYEKIETAATLLEQALRHEEPRDGIWEDSDYMVAALAILTDGDRARSAALDRFRLDSTADEA